ncbi:hypothetical protein Ae201684P_010415 [Aphanomyces euteiches]|uniref:Uncharacterized protein n=1 Tax=Aphanomyces euteiches TaxID=100861 RepID=A0A6G0W6M4_9STRA|nr:hypothetical protein Ae201684_018220 [Aphanomyces euteiches]KAH9076471.1 hypothetical protein Ae201684P_010415 [Aphanomyces euteiches]KAH9156369.1 hypothetical protein AeRB84_001713 [Aphanomyces euteiches]
MQREATKNSAKRPRAEGKSSDVQESRMEHPPQRISPRQAAASAATATKNEKSGDEFSLMTERQQIAFLMRQSAQEKTSSASESDDDPPKRKHSANKENMPHATMRRRKKNLHPNVVATPDPHCCLCTSWTDTLFLCSHCDKKYPTLKTLGLAA